MQRRIGFAAAAIALLVAGCAPAVAEEPHYIVETVEVSQAPEVTPVEVTPEVSAKTTSAVEVTETPTPTAVEPQVEAADSETVAPGLLRATVARVIDGDTIEVIIDGASERVRLIGVDSPERDAVGFAQATDFTRERIDGVGNVVYLRATGNDRDRFDRLRRCVYLDPSGDELLNDLIVAYGHGERVTTFGTCSDTAPVIVPPPPAAPEPETAAPAAIRAPFANCTEVWAELGRPIHAGEPGFHSRLDRDNDGVGCESRPR